MTKVKGAKNEIAGKTKQAVGEVLGDQGLHDEGKRQEKEGKKQKEEPSEVNPLRRLNQLT
ncbi:CsbD family protein [Bradyrhizobium sp. STM 3562]|uniref:CsbD family protein n=1 Tax=Bradyrhizobium sp. STM 3562 TaxID=578924 RepID=UPI00388E6D67